jgi:hypothetical protein
LPFRLLAAPPVSLPLRETQGKNFFSLAPLRKVIPYQNLERESPVESKARQGSGKEARKPPDWRLASADHY